MKNYSSVPNVRLESKSVNQIESYFERAGIFGHLFVMVTFYLLVLAAFLAI